MDVPVRKELGGSLVLFFVFTNSVPSSASAAEAATILSIAHVIAILPFSWIGSPSRGMLPRKKQPPARLRPLPADM